jgi:hypothetical protein
MSGDKNITTLTTITAIRPTSWNILLSPKTYTTGATMTGDNLDLNFINKFHFTPLEDLLKCHFFLAFQTLSIKTKKGITNKRP